MIHDQDKIKKELARLTRRGVIQPVDVVNAAKNPKSPLHHLFTWDDDKAAHEYRLYQARQILRTYVVIEDAAAQQTVRAFVSLRQDRKLEGGGYRHIADVLSDEQLYEQMLADSLAEMRAFQQKYARIKELRGVFDAVEVVAVQFDQQQMAKAA